MAQARGNLYQHLVAHLMALAVVDVFEMIKIEVQHGDFALVSQCQRIGLIKAVSCQGSVRQVGEYIVMSQVLQSQLSLWRVLPF